MKTPRPPTLRWSYVVAVANARPYLAAPLVVVFFPGRRRHTRLQGDWSSDVCSSDLLVIVDLADEEARLREQVVTYREMALSAIAELADRTRELEFARRRIVQLINELRQQRGEIGRASCRERV